MQQLLTASLVLAMARLKKLAESILLQNTDESTFRSLLLREVVAKERSSWGETEWSRERVDLLVGCENRIAVVELKYYIHRCKYDMDRNFLGWKGGPSSANENEFRECVQKLVSLEEAGKADRFLVLVYERMNPKDLNSKNSYARSYDDLEEYGIAQSNVTEIDHAFDGLACKLIEVPVSP